MWGEYYSISILTRKNTMCKLQQQGDAFRFPIEVYEGLETLKTEN